MVLVVDLHVEVKRLQQLVGLLLYCEEVVQLLVEARVTHLFFKFGVDDLGAL